MHIDELCDRFNLSRQTINRYVSRGLIPPPHGRGTAARYGPECVAALTAYQALKHNNTTLKDLGQYLREQGITITDYVKEREESIRYHGMGVA